MARAKCANFATAIRAPVKPSPMSPNESGSLPWAAGDALNSAPAGGPRVPHSRAAWKARGGHELESVFDDGELDAERRKDLLAKAAFRMTATRAAGPVPGVEAGFRPETAAKAHVRNPWAIWKPSDLFIQCGPLLTVFIGVQIASACMTARWLAEQGVLDRALLTGMLPLLFLTLDALTFVSLRGRLLPGFAKPALWLAAATLAPGGLALGLFGFASSRSAG